MSNIYIHIYILYMYTYIHTSLRLKRKELLETTGRMYDRFNSGLGTWASGANFRGDVRSSIPVLGFRSYGLRFMQARPPSQHYMPTIIAVPESATGLGSTVLRSG